MNSAPSVTVTEAAKLARADGAALIDVRTPAEYKSGHARGAQNCPLDRLDSYVESLKGFREVYVICQSGGRSATATGILRSAGIAATNVSGGTLAWRASGLPVS